jgi:NADH-quinone oxidoreductase subunit L
MGGEQDITKMGGLVKKLPITAWTFVIGVLAISGFPFTSGFVSKDEILLAVLAHSPVLFWFAVFAAILTAAYMFRLMMLVFFGGFRGTHEQEHHLHESPSAMTIPLIILGVLSLIGGFVQLPHVFGGEDFFNQFLAPIVPAVTHEGAEAATLEYYLLGGTIVILVIVYVVTKKLFAVDRFDGVYTGFKKVLADKWYIDELYNAVIVNPLDKLAGFLKNVVEKSGIDGIVNGVGKFVNYASRQLRLLQSGQVGNYILFMVLSIAVLFLVFWNQEIIVQFLQKIF